MSLQICTAEHCRCCSV